MADVVIISDIFPAREQDTGLIHAQELVDAMVQRAYLSQRASQILYGSNLQSTQELLSRTLCTNDLAVIMGAGDIYTVTKALLYEAV